MTIFILYNVFIVTHFIIISLAYFPNFVNQNYYCENEFNIALADDCNRNGQKDNGESGVDCGGGGCDDCSGTV